MAQRAVPYRVFFSPRGCGFVARVVALSSPGLLSSSRCDMATLSEGQWSR